MTKQKTYHIQYMVVDGEHDNMRPNYRMAKANPAIGDVDRQTIEAQASEIYGGNMEIGDGDNSYVYLFNDSGDLIVRCFVQEMPENY